MTRFVRGKPNRLTILLVGLAVVLFAGLVGCSREAEYNAMDITGVMPDLTFDLTSENGEGVGANNYENAVRLLFFGYTHCPDVCPATMARVRAALGGLDEQLRNRVTVLFVSVDPKRDTLKQLANFTSNFGPQFVGLIGTQRQLKALSERYSVDYSYGAPNDKGFYTVSHSSRIFVFDPKGQARLLVSADETVGHLTQDLKTLFDSED